MKRKHNEYKEEHYEFLALHFMKFSVKELGKKLVENFPDLQLPCRGQIDKMMARRGLEKTAQEKKAIRINGNKDRRKLKPHHLEFIKKNFHKFNTQELFGEIRKLYRKELPDLNYTNVSEAIRKLGLARSKEEQKKNKQKAVRKTKQPNEKEIGSICIRMQRCGKTRMIKTGIGKGGYVNYNRWMYEQAYGSLSADDLVIVKEGVDPLQAMLQDLELKSRADFMSNIGKTQNCENLPVGTISFVTKNDTKQMVIKTGKGTKGWRVYLRWLWEKHHGLIPKGMMIVFKEGTDKENPTIDTIECVPKKGYCPPTVKNLEDKFIINTLSHGKDEEYKKLVRQMPELIAMTRERLLINRKIKQHGNLKITASSKGYDR